MKNYKFDRPLVEGIIIERQHSFIMLVEYNGKIERCHCPCISSIGHIELAGRPCLLWDSQNPRRKTRYTVKAVSLNKPEDKRKKWIGIDQMESNRYVEHFLNQNAFKEMLDTQGLEILHEQTLGESRLDFKVGDTYIENKTILRMDMPIPDYIKTKKRGKLKLSDHFYKHINELKNALNEHERAILLATFLYDYGYLMGHESERGADKGNQIEKAMNRGVESWQVNFIVTPIEVKFGHLYKIGEN